MGVPIQHEKLEPMPKSRYHYVPPIVAYRRQIDLVILMNIDSGMTCHYSVPSHHPNKENTLSIKPLGRSFDEIVVKIIKISRQPILLRPNLTEVNVYLR